MAPNAQGNGDSTKGKTTPNGADNGDVLPDSTTGNEMGVGPGDGTAIISCPGVTPEVPDPILPSATQAEIEHALNFIDQVKIEFVNKPQHFQEFLDVMKKFRFSSIDVHVMRSRISQLFRGHPDLIIGFNKFAPSEYKLETEVQNGINYKVVKTVHTGLVAAQQTQAHQGIQHTTVVQKSSPANEETCPVTSTQPGA